MPSEADAGRVETVTGPVEASALGHTLTHEHLYVDWPSATGAEPVPAPSENVIETIGTRLERAADAGVSSFVDVGACFGPGPELLRAVAARTRVRLLASIGCLAVDMGPLPPWAYPPASPETVAEHFIEESRDGIAGSGVRPSLIKVGSSRWAISEVEETIFRGAALAQADTGLAITTHTTETTLAMEQVDLLERAGADLGRVAIGHLGWGTGPGDRDLHRAVAGRGVFVGLDMVGLPARSVEDYARMAADLIADGHSGQILLSHDNCAYSRGLIEVYGEEWLTGDFTVVHNRLVPELLKLGVAPDTIEAILRDNPRRFLSTSSTPEAGVATGGAAATG